MTAERAPHKHQSLHAALAGVPNRALFERRLENGIAAAAADRARVAVVLVDLGRFREINDTRGHGGGDVLLRAVALRVKRLLRLRTAACAVTRRAGSLPREQAGTS